MTLGEAAALLGARLEGGDPGARVRDASGLDSVAPGEITFALDDKHLAAAIGGPALAVLVAKAPPQAESAGKAFLVVANPIHAFSLLLAHLHPPEHGPEGVSPLAYVAPDARIGEGASVHPFAYVAEGASVGRGTVLYPGVFVGRGSSVGEQCVLYPNVVLREGVAVGDRAVIHSGAVLGADGFGFYFHEGAHRKIPQVGGVRVGDDVEIGACTCIDRATTGETVIGPGSKIDNQVQVGHNASIGPGVILVAQVGVGGSAEIGPYAMIGGQSAIQDHAWVEGGSKVGACSGVMGRLQKGVYVGTPVMPQREFFRSVSLFAKLPEMNRRLLELEQRIDVFAPQGQGGGGEKKK